MPITTYKLHILRFDLINQLTIPLSILQCFFLNLNLFVATEVTTERQKNYFKITEESPP